MKLTLNILCLLAGLLMLAGCQWFRFTTTNMDIGPFCEVVPLFTSVGSATHTYLYIKKD